MEQPSYHVLERKITWLIISLIMMILMLPSLLPIHTQMSPMLLVSGVFFWSLLVPIWMPFWAVFIAGLIYDVFTGLPLGLSSALLCVLSQSVLVQQRHLVLQPFPIVWLVFAVSVSVFALATWGVMGLYYRQLLPYDRVMWDVLMTIALYPLFHLLFMWLYKRFIGWYSSADYEKNIQTL